MKSIRLLPDFGKPVLDSHNPFYPCFVPQHNLRNSLEGQDQWQRFQLGQNCGMHPPTLFRRGAGGWGGEEMVLEQVGRNQRSGLARGTWHRPVCSPSHDARLEL